MILVDSHVHIYGLFNLPGFLSSAHANFYREAARVNRENDFMAVLCLTDTDDNRLFNRLAAHADSGSPGTAPWSFHHTGENNSLYAESTSRERLYIIAGRQIVTRENLELLAIAINRDFEERLPIEDLIHGVNASGAIPVIPWGFGKWTGKRGRIVNGLIDGGPHFFLGDNSGRSRWLPYPSQFTRGLKRGIRILPGSDPLPFVSECHRGGCFGFAIDGTLCPDRPADDLKRMLSDPGISCRSYGRLESGCRFVKHQLGMQILKRFKKGMS
ncbi:MAG: hypothetical protein GY737_18370 [Desulfobacteraceae bacterium]|nr:hypothetical protein [Desulfobacteraceae bacterium]